MDHRQAGRYWEGNALLKGESMRKKRRKPGEEESRNDGRRKMLVRDGGLRQSVLPVRHGHLRGQHQGAALIAVITDFQEVAGKCCNNVERSGGMAGGFQRDSTR